MTFSWARCLISVFCGMCGNVISGMISDKYSKTSNKAYSKICMASSLFGIPLTCLSVLITNNFWVSLIGLGFR